MSWLQIKFTATREQAPSLAEALEVAGALAVSIEDARDERVLQAGLESTPLWIQNQVMGLFPESIDIARVLHRMRETLGAAGVPEYRLEPLPDADWARAWMSRYHPLHVGRRLWICPSWCIPPDAEAVTVFLDPGLAFGTGDHATTALCLEWLSEQALPGLTLIDYGCGSGILAIAALKLGARHAYALDIDPLALIATRGNAARNNVEEHLTAVTAEGQLPVSSADIVIANILAGPLVELAPRLTALVRDGGGMVLTGLLAEQRDEVCAHYAAHFAFETRRRGEWVLLAGTKHGGG